MKLLNKLIKLIIQFMPNLWMLIYFLNLTLFFYLLLIIMMKMKKLNFK